MPIIGNYTFKRGFKRKYVFRVFDNSYTNLNVSILPTVRNWWIFNLKVSPLKSRLKMFVFPKSLHMSII
jgi:hypothetical protein